MLNLYRSTIVPPYLNSTAASLLTEGREQFRQMKLDQRRIIQDGNDVLVFPWHGDRVVNTITLQMRSDGLQVASEGIALRVLKASGAEVSEYFKGLPTRTLKTPLELAAFVKNKISEKFDLYLTDELLNAGYASGNIAVAETAEAVSEIVSTHARSDGHH
jgi:ATP-dependent Lhr-like helicase